MDVTQRHNSNVGENPVETLDMARSYAAVVRSPFKSSTSLNGAEMKSVSNASNPRNQSIETKRTMIDEKDDCLGTNNKKQRMSSTLSAINNENSKPNKNYGDMYTFLRQLDQALELEVTYRGTLQPSSSALANAVHGHSARTRSPMLGSAGATITSEMRDCSSHILRFLKVWYDLPPDVFFAAVSNIDRFLGKIKVSGNLFIANNNFRHLVSL